MSPVNEIQPRKAKKEKKKFKNQNVNLKFQI